MKNFLYLMFVFTFLFSCKKAEERTCFKSTGELSELDVAVETFNELNLGKSLNYALVRDTVNFIRVKGGRNLLQSIYSEVIDGILYIENKNRCNFLRSYAEILEVEIHFTHLNRIEGRISHDLRSNDTIVGSYFNLELTGASGNVQVLVDTDFINGFVNDGNGDYSIAGKTKYAHIQANSNGLADARGLWVQEQLEVSSRSIRAIFCHAEGIPLVVNIEATGDVFYTGTPSSIALNRTGSGNLIQVD